MHPLSAAVLFKPAPTNCTAQTITHGCVRYVPGYRFASGGGWGGEYLVGELSYVADVDVKTMRQITPERDPSMLLNR